MDFYRTHSTLYQVLHPWHWLTYGQNATAAGIFVAALVNLVTVYVLLRTLYAVNKQAVAADRQAKAAEEQARVALKQTEVLEQQRILAERATKAAEQQARAAESATAVSDAQRIATEESAKAERLHSELLRQQLLAHLRPILMVKKHLSGQTGTQYFVENHGEGVALAVTAMYRRGSDNNIQLASRIIGPTQAATLSVNWSTVQEHGMQLKYESQDGRNFATVIEAQDAKLPDFFQSTFEIDPICGWIAQPKIPKAD